MHWNHNVHYHRVVLRAIPPACARALDVGCGRGDLARKMTMLCQEVVGIDVDHDCLVLGQRPNLTLLQGDILAHPFRENSFDFVSAVASLHHLPLRPALECFAQLLRPGGILAIIGLYRDDTAIDYATACIALPLSWMRRSINGESEVGAPLSNPVETLRTIREACDATLPGGAFRRRLFFRYSFVWRKPG